MKQSIIAHDYTSPVWDLVTSEEDWGFGYSYTSKKSTQDI